MAAPNMPAKEQDSLGMYILELAVGLFFMFGFGYVVPPFGIVMILGAQIIGIFIGIIWSLTWFEMSWRFL